MAKKTITFSSSGELSFSEGLMYEVRDESVDVINLFNELKKFDGKSITIIITQDIDIVNKEK